MILRNAEKCGNVRVTILTRRAAVILRNGPKASLSVSGGTVATGVIVVAFTLLEAVLFEAADAHFATGIGGTICAVGIGR